MAVIVCIPGSMVIIVYEKDDVALPTVTNGIVDSSVLPSNNETVPVGAGPPAEETVPEKVTAVVSNEEFVEEVRAILTGFLLVVTT